MEQDVIREKSENPGRIAELEAEIKNLHYRQSLLESVLSSAPLVIFAIDASGVFTLIEGKASEQIGIDPKALIGTNIFDLDADFSGITAAARQALTGVPKVSRIEMNGRILEAQILPVRDASGALTGAVIVAEDITESHIAATHHERQFEFLRALNRVRTMDELLEATVEIFGKTGINSGTVFLINTDDRGEYSVMTSVTSWTASGSKALLPTGTEVDMGDQFIQIWMSDPSKIYHVADVVNEPRLTPESREAMSAGDMNAMMIVPLSQADNLIGIILLTWPEVHEISAADQVVYASLPAMFSPVAESARLIDELAQNIWQLDGSRRLAQENARIKSEFLATMSHELRTPLNAIEGFTSIILNNMGGATYNDKTERYVTKVQTNSKRLLSLINDFLDLSRIESGRFELAMLPFSPRNLSAKWRSDIGVLAEQKGLVFSLEVDDAVPAMLYGDEEAISKVVINLLSNAIKFTETGSVSMAVTSDGTQWSVAVTDSGIGIPPHATEYIFDEFRQVDQTSKRRFGGTGLGLSIVQKLTRAMGGTITLQSTVGVGSTFTMSLPVKLALDQTAQSEVVA